MKTIAARSSVDFVRHPKKMVAFTCKFPINFLKKNELYKLFDNKNLYVCVWYDHTLYVCVYIFQ